MSYINNATGEAETINAIGLIESITTIGDTTTVTAKAQAQTCKAVGQLGIKKILEKDYEKLNNKPSINGVVLEGNKTTEDLGIEIPEVDLSNYYTKGEIDVVANQMMEAIPEIIPLEEFDPEAQYEDNQITNANALAYLVQDFSTAFDDVYSYIDEVGENIFTVQYTLNPQTMEMLFISHYSSEIIQAFNKGKKVTFKGYVAGLNVYVNSEIQLVDGQYVFTYPLLKVNLGQGEKTYFFRIGVYREFGTIEPYALVDIVRLNQTEEKINNTLYNLAMSKPDTSTVINIVNHYINEALMTNESRLLPENAEEGSILKYINGKWTPVEDNRSDVTEDITIEQIEKMNVSIFEGKTVEEIERATSTAIKSVQEIEQMSVSNFEEKLVKEAEKQ